MEHLDEACEHRAQPQDLLPLPLHDGLQAVHAGLDVGQVVAFRLIAVRSAHAPSSQYSSKLTFCAIRGR